MMSVLIAITILAGGMAVYCYFSARSEQRRQEWHRRCRVNHLKAF